MTSIFYSCPAVPIAEASKIVAEAKRRFNLDIAGHGSVKELILALVQTKSPVDFVVLDIEEFKSLGDVYTTIKTIKTLSLLENPNSRLVAVVDKGIDLNFLKSLISLDEVDFFSPRYGEFTAEDVLSGVENYTSYGERVHPLVKGLCVVKKRSKSKDIQLTTRQQQILEIISTRGASNKVIAKMLNISESTVKLHVGAILRKYGVKNRTQLAVFSKSH